VWSTLLNIITGAAILFLVMAGWFGVQHLARKAEHLPPDCDMLDRPEKGCGCCHLHGKCDREAQMEKRAGR